MDQPVIAPILSTKFYIPRPRKALVGRPALSAKLNGGIHRKLILVSAPAGYGKTTLITSWIDERCLPAAWISLDAGDNDYYRFFTYFLAALQQTHPQFGGALLQMVQSSQPPAPESLITLLLNEIARLQDENLFVIDDYHLIHNPAIHQAFQQIIDAAPPQLHFIICTRSELPFSISRLRSHDDLLELTQAELCLTQEECGRFLALVMHLALAPDEITILHDRTEGWLVGLQLAALSIQHSDDPSGFIRCLKGDNRYITDYLVDEVLSSISENLQDFLLRTSILSQMEASLCNAVLQIRDSQELLEALDKEHLFIIPLDDSRRWFRYHHLFGEMLYDRLVRKSPEDLSGLYQRASEWYAGHKMLEDAIDYALAAGSYDQAERLIRQIGPPMLSKGGWNRLLAWFDQFPEDEFLGRPDLWLTFFVTVINAGLITTAARKIRKINLETLDKDRLTEDALHQINGELASVQGVIDLHSRADPAAAKNSLSIAMQYLADEPHIAGHFAGFNYGVACMLLGQLDEARAAVETSIRWGKRNDFSLGKVMGASFLAEITAMQGGLHPALELYQEAEEFAHDYGVQEGAVFSKTNLGLGELYYEWNQLEQAVEYLHKGIRLAEQGGYLDQLLPGYATLARIQEMEGDRAGVQETMRRARRMSEKYGDPPQAVSYFEAVKADLALQRGDLVYAADWAAGVKLPAPGVFNCYSQYEQVVLLRLLVTKGDQKVVEAVIHPLRNQAARQGRVADAIALDVIYARHLYMTGQPALALEILQNALTLGQPDRFVRTFLDEGGVVISIIKQLLAAGVPPDTNGKAVSAEYLHFLLEAVDTDSQKAAARPSNPRSVEGIDALTEQELRALRLIKAGYTNKQIAQEMMVSLNTVKYHLKNIYGKLGVENRTQAARVFQKKG